MRNFIQEKKAQAPVWFSADGWEQAEGEQENEFQDANGDTWAYASAGQRQTQAAAKSQPYVLRLVNACTTAIANVDIGDSYLQRAASNFGQSANITLTSVPSGTSYIEFMAQTENQPFKVGKTVIICTTAAQFNETITITHRDANGDRQDKSFLLTIDPYQTQTDRVILDVDYLFNGYTRLRFSNIVASATVNVHLYPSDKFSAVQSVAGRDSQLKFSAPQLVKVMQVGTPAQAPRLLRRK